MLSSAFDLLLVILGFSLIIVVHELGHFIAARWAGIRVLAFAVGFGPALCSYRHGLGLRAGSSETEFRSLVKSGKSPEVGGEISPTEYRLNVLPLGGYVKMLGQEDADPTAVSDASDSYQNCPTPKRMIVISAGVVMNLLLAAVLFCVVFLIGLKAEPARVGQVLPGSPAALALPASSDHTLGGTPIEPGLKSGDEILAIDGDTVDTFQDVSTAVVMAKGGRELSFLVRRSGHVDDLLFRVSPKEGREYRTLEIGIGPMRSTLLAGSSQDGPAAQRAEFERLAARFGVPELEPGDRLVEINGLPVANVYALDHEAQRSGGAPLAAVFEREGPNARRVELTIDSVPSLQESTATLADGRLVGLRHILGLLPVLRVDAVSKEGAGSGLLAGDVFARLGDAEYPSVYAGIAQVRAHAGKSVRVIVVRDLDGTSQEVDLGDVPVSRKGTIGFEPGDTALHGTWITVWPGVVNGSEFSADDQTPASPPLLRDGWLPGSRLISVNGQSVSDLADVRDALRTLANEPAAVVKLGYVLPVASASNQKATTQTSATSGPETIDSAPAESLASTPSNIPVGPVQFREFTLDQSSQSSLGELTWVSALPTGMFELEQIVLQESNPIAGIGRGVERTRGVIVMTYLTFVRLFEGTVKVEHVKGPVGIAHIGTLLAGKGIAWLLFFLALISVNLAVINFLPIPITDGGHFLFLLYEQFSGKPPPVAVQNAAALVGLVLLGGVFLFVLVNDIMNLVK